MKGQSSKQQRVAVEGQDEAEGAGSGEGAASALARMKSQRERRHAERHGATPPRPADDDQAQQPQ
jgi:hypothetical protein